MTSSSRNPFADAAAAYATSEIHAKGDDLEAMVAYARSALGDLSGASVLDVATGAGHTAIAFARAGAHVTALDITPEMLDVARELAAEKLESSESGPAGTRAQPVLFRAGSADSLPFDDASFDVVACRIAAHHFEAPHAFVSEAERVLKPGGRLLLVDNIAPEASDLDETMNRIELERDPTHVRAYTVKFWIDALVAADLAPEHLDRWARDKDFRDWVQRSRTPKNVVAELEAFLLALTERAQQYFGVQTEQGRVARLRHEVMFLAAAKIV